MDFLKSAVASAISKGPPFPYTFGDRLDLDQSIWTLYNGIKREDGSDCSIFSFDITANKSRLVLAKNAVRKLKTLRHPGIVRVLDTVETETYIYIATERVVPLKWHLRRKSLSTETVKWGLYTVANTLKFINEDGSSVHGCIRASSVFTSQSGEWRLGGLDLLSSMKEDDAVIYKYAGLVPEINRYAPSEVAKSDWTTVRKSPVSATDSYAYGLLIYESFNGGDLPMEISATQTKNIPPSMQQPYKRLLNPNPKARLTVGHFLEQGRRSGGYFETPLIRLSEGVESMGLKDDTEREALLGELDEVSDDFPEDFFKSKILPELIKSVEFGGGGSKVLGYVMKLATKLPDDEFESRLNPFLLRQFASPDRQIRVSLLDSLPQMIDHFPQKVVTDKIWPQVATGFSDTAPIVREQTVKSVLVLVNKLSDRTINSELLKCLAKTSNDDQPGIRTNTTICLGKIARNLGTSTRPKVLVAAFTRSLRDPFIHARNAALQAIAATSDMFSEEDCATKLLPAICPSLVDKEKVVRDQANKTMDVLMSRIRKYTTNMPDSVLPLSKNLSASGIGTPRMSSPIPDAGAAGWAGWAISSFTNKIAATNGDIQPVIAVSKTNGHILVPTKEVDSLHPTRIETHTLISARISPNPTILIFDKTVDHDAEMDAEDFNTQWSDEAGGEEQEDGASFFDALSTPQPINSPNPNQFDDGGEPDFAGWLNAQSKSKSKLKNMNKSKQSSVPALVVSKGLKQSSKSSPIGLGGKVVAGGKISASAESLSHTQTKRIDTKPKDDGEGDGWDAWD